MNQYTNAICMNRPTVASEKYRMGYDRRRGDVSVSRSTARSTDQTAPSGRSIPQKSSMRSRSSPEPSTSGLRCWIESIRTHTTTFAALVW